MPSAAPRSRARFSLASLLEVMMTRAPLRRADCRADSGTPPVPWGSTTSPALTRPRARLGLLGECQRIDAEGTAQLDHFHDPPPGKGAAVRGARPGTPPRWLW